MKEEPKVYIKCTEEEAKVHIEFTKKEIEVVYHALTQEMNQSLKSGISYNINFETLEHWYLLLKKIKVAKDLYEQATSEEEN